MALTPVQETLFFPLLGRADACHKWPHIFPDEWAEYGYQIAKKEGTSAHQLDAFSNSVYGCRHQMTVKEIQSYVDTHPGCAIVVIGCGLDRLTGDIDAPDSTFYNLDFPDVLELRHRWVEPDPQEKDLPYSVTDVRWFDEVDGSKGLIAVAAGVFYYIEVPDIARMIQKWGEHFPGSRLVYDAESPMITRGSERSIAKSGVSDARMPFKVKDPYSPRDWSTRVSNVDVIFDMSTYSDKRQQLPWHIRGWYTLMKLIKGMYVVRVDF